MGYRAIGDSSSEKWWPSGSRGLGKFRLTGASIRKGTRADEFADAAVDAPFEVVPQLMPCRAR